MNNKEEAKTITKTFLADYFSISEEETEQVISKLTRLVFTNGEPIVLIGDDPDGVYFIDEGQASVFSAAGECINELYPGQCLGEYAILAREKRMATVRAHGKAVVFRLSPEDFLGIVSKYPMITGKLIKSVYGQVSIKHSRLAYLTKKSRGVTWSPEEKKDAKTSSLILTYGLTALLFIAVFIYSAAAEPSGILLQILPLLFLIAFTIRTKRIVEGMLLTLMLLGGMLFRGRFITGMGNMLIAGIGNPDTASTIVIMAMVEAVSALLASAGVVSAFSKFAEKRIKSKKSALLSMLLIMIAVCLDECLNVLTAGYCLNDITDKYGVPREHRALIAGFSTAICSLIPFSLWSAYISGWISMYLPSGGNIFLHSILFNAVGWISLVMVILLCFDRFPRSKQIREAYKRVEDGGEMWPKGSEDYYEADISDGVVGSPLNLLLPMLVWALSSVICGIIGNRGSFALDPVSGLIITILFMFALYVGQKLMRPKSFFDIMSGGISNALMPILLLVMSERIADSLISLGLLDTMETAIPALVGGNLALIPAVAFVFCTLLDIAIGSCWGMYGLGIPLIVFLASKLSLNIPLCLGAVLSAGIIGDGLCPYLDFTAPAVTAIGCEPTAFRHLRINYWLPIGAVCIIIYVILGLIFI